MKIWKSGPASAAGLRMFWHHARRILAVTLSLVGWITLGSAVAQEVLPDFYQEPGLFPNRDYVNQHVTEYVDPFSGALQLHSVDLYLPGNGGFDLEVVRSYNSASIDPTNPAAFDSLAGLGWTVHFGRVLKTHDAQICVNRLAYTVADNPVLELPDGSRQPLYFTESTSPLILTAQRWRADCLSSSTGLAVYSPEGVRYEMAQQVTAGQSHERST